jgi:integrase
MRRERKDRVHGPYKHGQQWRLVFVRADGERIVESFETEARANGVAAAARAQSESRTLSVVVDAYEVSMRERQLAGVTIDRARAHLETLLALPSNGHRRLTWLTPKRAAELYAALVPKMSVDSHRNALAAGRSLGRFAVEHGWTKADPFAAVKGVGRRKKGKAQLHIDEARKLEDVCFAEGTREAYAVITGFLCAFGPSEVAHRQVRDLDDGGRLLHVTKGKNRYRVRTSEVPEHLRAPLLALAKGRPGSAYLFGANDIDRPSRYWVYWHCVRLAKLAKVPHVSPHGLRGTHSTIAMGHASSSVSVAAALAGVRAGLGHAPGSPITASTYVAPGAVDRAKQRAAMRVLKGGRS